MPDNKMQTGNDALDTVPFMNTLTSCINKAMKDGYTDNFKVDGKRLVSSQKEAVYRPEQVKIVNFYRFEGQSDPSDNAIMYLIETTDETKGILIDAYGAYADDAVNKFVGEVEKINKKVHKNEG